MNYEKLHIDTGQAIFNRITYISVILFILKGLVFKREKEYTTRKKERAFTDILKYFKFINLKYFKISFVTFVHVSCSLFLLIGPINKIKVLLSVSYACY